MFEIKITWSEKTKVPSIYQFKTLEEARSFQRGILETSHKIADCPQIHRVERGRWGNPPVLTPVKQSPWLSLIFSILVGFWTVLWWYLFNQNTSIAIKEYFLIGSLTALGCYLGLLIYRWLRKN